MILLEYGVSFGLVVREQARLALETIPDMAAGTLERSILANLGITTLLVNEAVVGRGGLLRRIGFDSTAAFDVIAPTDDAKIAILTNLFTSAIGVQTGANVEPFPVELDAPPPDPAP